jgi:hypothetical protein
METMETQARDGLQILMDIVRKDYDNWWRNPATGRPVIRNVGEMIALMHSELSEALEGHRKGLMDDHLPNRKMLDVEIADAIIRELDFASHLCPDLPDILIEKIRYNRQRLDHKPENRIKQGGKKY